MNPYKYNSKTPFCTAFKLHVKDSFYLPGAAFCTRIYYFFRLEICFAVVYDLPAGYEQIIAVVTIAAWQGICLAHRALIMAMHMNQYNIGPAEDTFRLHQ